MTNKEMMWLKHDGQVGACIECPFRKPFNEMNTELLPCNQYQCLVKLARLDKNEEDVQIAPTETTRANESDMVRNAYCFNIVSRQELPVRIINKLISEEKLKAMHIGKTFGTYNVLEFVGYELNEVADGRETAGNEYINYIFKCQCKRCGSIRYLTHFGLVKAKKKNSACRNCWRIPDDDERLIKWDK